MADFDKSKHKEFSNWVHNILALNVTKTALHKYVLDKWAAEIAKWKIESLDTLLQFFKEVEDGVVTCRHNTQEKWVCSQEHSECSKILDGLNKLRQNDNFTISCKTVLCGKIVNKDIKEPDAVGVFRELSGESQVKTNKTNPQNRCNDYSSIFEGCKTIHIWCLANMFMQSESFKNKICNTCPGNTDSAMFFRMMKNCKLFELDDGDIYQKVVDVRNKLHHSVINRLEAQDSKTNLETMKTLLKEFPNTEDAITKIDEMENRTLALGDVKKVLYLKTFALDTDIKIEREKGYSSDEIEELMNETKEQFHNTELVHFMTLKSTEDIKKENEMYPEMIDELVGKSNCLEMMDLQDELKEHTKMLSKAMDETDFQTGDRIKAEDLLANARRVRNSFDELKEQRFKVTQVAEGFDFQTKIMTSFKELREEVTNTKQEIADMRGQTNQTPIGNNKATENQIESGASESNGHTAKMNTVGIESQQESQNAATTPEERAVSTSMEDFEDFTYDIDEVEIFQDKTNLEPNKTSGSNETSKLPLETYCKTGRRFIASVSFRQSATQFTVNPSTVLTRIISNKHLSLVGVEFMLSTTQEFTSEILLNRMKEVVEYGSKAKDKYYNLDQNENREHYFYFESLRINGREGLTENLKIEDVTGRSMNAVDVYGAAIKYLKGKMLNNVAAKSFKDHLKEWQEYMRGKVDDADLDIEYSNITEDDIFWVFTEPAVSSFGVKRCITEAAGKITKYTLDIRLHAHRIATRFVDFIYMYGTHGRRQKKAGIQNENVAVIPESVATLIFCKHVSETRLGPDLSFEKDTRYSIVDAGEQTVTISTYEVTDQSIFKELEAPVEYTVNPNAVFEDFVTEIIGKKAGGQRSSSEADTIVLVGHNHRIGYILTDAIEKKFPNKRLYVPHISLKAVVSGAAFCCFTQLSVKK